MIVPVVLLTLAAYCSAGALSPERNYLPPSQAPNNQYLPPTQAPSRAYVPPSSTFNRAYTTSAPNNQYLPPSNSPSPNNVYLPPSPSTFTTPSPVYLPPSPTPRPNNAYVPPPPAPRPNNAYVPPPPPASPNNVYLPPSQPNNVYLPPSAGSSSRGAFASSGSSFPSYGSSSTSSRGSFASSGSSFASSGSSSPSSGSAFASTGTSYPSSSGSAFASSGSSYGSSGITGAVFRQEISSSRPVAILKQVNDNKGDGVYTFSYETEDGTAAEERGQLKADGAEGTLSAHGSYSFTAPDNVRYTVTYTADENGFQPQGAHLPVPPPIPEAILKSLADNAAEEARGIVDDGSYKGEGQGYPRASAPSSQVDASYYQRNSADQGYPRERPTPSGYQREQPSRQFNF